MGMPLRRQQGNSPSGMALWFAGTKTNRPRVGDKVAAWLVRRRAQCELPGNDPLARRSAGESGFPASAGTNRPFLDCHLGNGGQKARGWCRTMGLLLADHAGVLSEALAWRCRSEARV